MKLLIRLILFFSFNTTFAADATNDQQSVDHSSIFQHSNNMTPPDIKSMQQAQVVSVINTKGYTYIEITKNDVPVWLAVPATVVEAGDTVHFTDGPTVLNHHSRTLDRTFDSVIFLLSVVVNSDK